MIKKKNINNVEPVVELHSVSTTYGEFNTNVVPKKYETRKKWQPKNPKEIRSFIPGTITEMSVKEGDEIKVGDTLYGFKAMKMVNSVESELDGVIKSVNYNLGESFPKGVVIIEFE